MKWDSVPGSNEKGKEEDYRYGVDYEFDVMPAKGGMEAVDWPEGKRMTILVHVYFFLYNVFFYQLIVVILKGYQY